MIECDVICRFYGSYEAVYGGWAGNAFTTLTGGVAEKVKTSTVDPDYPVVSAEELFTRVHNALSTGSIVSATVYAPPVSKLGITQHYY